MIEKLDEICGDMNTVDYEIRRTLLKSGPQILVRGLGWGGLGFPAFSRPTTQFCMLNRPVPGEHLGNQSIHLTSRPEFSTDTHRNRFTLIIMLRNIIIFIYYLKLFITYII